MTSPNPKGLGFFIDQIIPFPDKKSLAIILSSNNSGYLMIWDLENASIRMYKIF